MLMQIGGNWQEGEEYQFRVGDRYYIDFVEMQNLQWQFQNENPIVVEVLQPEVELNSVGNGFYVSNIKITTATCRGEDDPYQGEAGKTAKIIRGPNLLDKPLFSFTGQNNESILENIKDTIEIVKIVKPIYNFKSSE